MKALPLALTLFVCAVACPRAMSQDRYQRTTDRYNYEAPVRRPSSSYGYSQTTDRPTAIQVQKALARKGFYYGPADGILGVQSREAIRQYQRTAGMKPTGVVDDRLLKALRITAYETYPVNPTPVRSKSVAADVQSALARKGFYSGGVDGVIGSRSREAIRQFQLSRGMRPTGSIDEALLRALGLL